MSGRINAIYHLPEHNVTPYADYHTATLYDRKRRVKYLKFRSEHELDRHGIRKGDKVQREGCLHIVNGKKLVFDIRNVVIDPLL